MLWLTVVLSSILLLSVQVTTVWVDWGIQMVSLASIPSISTVQPAQSLIADPPVPSPVPSPDPLPDPIPLPDPSPDPLPDPIPQPYPQPNPNPQPIPLPSPVPEIT